jgi:hypothetical protein
MLNLFRALSRRLYALFTTHLALDFEQQFLLQQSDRKADLLQKAQDLEEQGLTELAEELREQTKNLSLERPLSSVLPAAEDFQGGMLPIEDSAANGSSENSQRKKLTKRSRTKAK